MTTAPQGIAPFTDLAQARMSSTQVLFNYWQESRRNGVSLKRTEIDPAALKEVLHLLLLGDIEPDPFRVLFRLIGTAVADFSRQDFSGQYLDELSYDARDSIDWPACYRFVHANQVPVIGVNDLHFGDGRVASYEFAIFPLLRGTDVAGSFIAIEAYDDFDRLVIPDIPPVRRR